MNAKLIAEIGSIVKNYWPEVVYKERLVITQEQLSVKSTLSLGHELLIALPDQDHIRLSIDGTLSVYNIDPESTVEPLTCELLERKIIRKTVSYDIEVSTLGNETTEELFNMATISDYVTNHTCKMEIIE